MSRVSEEAGPPERGRPAGQSEVVMPESGETLQALAKINLFAGLPELYLKRIQALGQVEQYPYGALIFAEGTPGDKVYLILEGKVRISREVPGMGEEALAILKANDYFGEMALIEDFPRSADAKAHEACRLFVISKENLQDLLFVDRDLAYDLLWNFVRTLSGRLRETNDKMTFLAVSSRF
jgi:CRP/FNR family cyclic AMP-dependent transcriptional regulator